MKYILSPMIVPISIVLKLVSSSLSVYTNLYAGFPARVLFVFDSMRLKSVNVSF